MSSCCNLNRATKRTNGCRVVCFKIDSQFVKASLVALPLAMFVASGVGVHNGTQLVLFLFSKCNNPLAINNITKIIEKGKFSFPKIAFVSRQIYFDQRVLH